METILITGAAGKQGKLLREGLKNKFFLRLLDIIPIENAGVNEEVIQGDLIDFSSLKKAMTNVTCVIHLAAIPVEDQWKKIVSINIEGTYNIFEAARQMGVKRVIYASSCHTIGFQRIEKTADASTLPRPDTLYGASKVFGEALGRLYADKYGLSVACVRTGSCDGVPPPSTRFLSFWLSTRDFIHLIECCITAPNYHFITVYGVSKNTRSKYDNSHVAFLNYHPQDDSEIYAKDCLLDEDIIGNQFHGKDFCSAGFHGDISQID